MRVVVQRVSRAAVRVDGKSVAEIGPGLLLLVGVGVDSRPGDEELVARKVFHLRVFEDRAGKMNLALGDAGGEILVVPQFTLYGDVRKGRRPSWTLAASPETASIRVEALCRELEALGARVARGAFREHMEVELVNDGPVTIILDAAALPGPR
jgi:D-aminoacyl-tRNA deacylase